MFIKRFATLAMAMILVFSLAINAMAAPSSVDISMLRTFGQVVDEDELSRVEGELNPIIAGAISGSVGGAFHYATSPGEKSLSGLGKAVAKGAALGAAGAAAAVVGAIATGVTVTTTAATTAWASWGAANTGALQGALEHIF